MASAQNPTSSKELKDQAAAAALYVTEPQRQVKDSRKEANWPLDANGKLTSAGAATSLKRAEAKDLPSFPSVGIASSAAGGAAMLANQNTKSPEWWRPEASAGASKAAMLAKDYKMDPLWQPETSAAGSKAALLAHQRGHGAQFWEPTASDKALIAATGAVSGKTSKPKVAETGLADRYPDEKNAAKNALSAATVVHSNSVRSRNNDLPGLSDEEAEKIRKQATVAGMNADLFGSTPLIGPELEERKHQASLHAAAVSMAQGMYGKRDQAYRDKMGAARAAGRASAGSRALDHDSDEEDTPMSFMGLQETAQKLANERLARLNDPDEAYRKHWGTHSSPPKNRLSMFGGSRRRSSSEGGLESDEKDSRRIRGEMNLFKDKLKEIDARKRQEDRQALLAAAQRNVKNNLSEMDEDVFQRTGKMSPAMRAEWEAKARAKAQADSENRKSNYGKVALGGGKYLDQTEIDAIAQARVQPTLDAITAKAEHDREVDEQEREAEEERRRIERLNREAEKEKDRQIKSEWKHFRAEEKAERQEREAKEKEERSKSKQAVKDEKMQEKFEEDIRKDDERALQEHDKEAEREAKQAEKEHDKKLKEQWKLFKRQEKKREQEDKDKSREAAQDEKMQEKFDETVRKEVEEDARREQRRAEVEAMEASEAREAKDPKDDIKQAEKEADAAEKEHDKELKKEWKLLKQEDKKREEEEKSKKRAEEEARKEQEKSAKKENRLSAIFRRKSKKEKEPKTTEEDGRPIPVGTGTTTTVITGGAAAASADRTAQTGNEPEHLVPHHEEPHHNFLMPLEETPEALAANKQKPGGDLIQIFKRKKAEHDEKKRQSIDAGSSRGPSGSVIKGKEEPSKAQAPVGEPAPEALAPEHAGEPVKHEASAAPLALGAATGAAAGTAAAYEAHEHEKPSNAELQQPEAAHAIVSPPATERQEVAPSSSGIQQAAVDQPQEPASPISADTTPYATPAGFPPYPNMFAEEPSQVQGYNPVPVERESEAGATYKVPAPSVPPASVSDAAASAIAADAAVANEHIPEASAASNSAPASASTHQPTSTSNAASSAVVTDDAATGARNVEASASTEDSTGVTVPTTSTGETYAAIGSDKPVTTEVRHSILDKIEPRVNAGKPGFEGSEKFAAATADMRGTDHAGGDMSHVAPSSTPAAEADTTENARVQSSEAAPPAKQTAAAGASPSVEGQAHDAAVSERIAVPAAAAAAAEEAMGKEGSHGTPRQKESKSTHRISGFFRSKFGAAGKKLTKEHKAADGVTVAPTTEDTTKGKYVDAGDKHSSTVEAAIPANRDILERESRGIAIDPAYLENTSPVSPLSDDETVPAKTTVARGRTDLSEEARDTVDTEGLALPKMPAALGRTAESPARETRFKEQI